MITIINMKLLAGTYWYSLEHMPVYIYIYCTNIMIMCYVYQNALLVADVWWSLCASECTVGNKLLIVTMSQINLLISVCFLCMRICEKFNIYYGHVSDDKTICTIYIELAKLARACIVSMQDNNKLKISEISYFEEYYML